MAEVKCSRCGRSGAQLTAPPLPGVLGHRIYDSTCQSCWQDWLRHQTAIINHYGLNLADPRATAILKEELEAFFFGENQQVAEDWTPPGQSAS